MEEENNISYNKSASQLPLYERPGRLNPDRNIPMDRRKSVDVNVHYDDARKGYLVGSNVPEFTNQSANAMDPFEDEALLMGDVKPKVVGVRSGISRVESMIFVPEIDNEQVKKEIKAPVTPEVQPEPVEQPVYIAEEDRAASSDYIADAFSGMDDIEAVPQPVAAKPHAAVTDVAKLKMYVLLLAVTIILETAGIAILIAI